MSTSNTSFNIAELRDEAAKNISEMGVYRSVVENVVVMDADLDDKISILLNSVPDLGIILAQLSLCKSRGFISESDCSEITKLCILEIRNRGKYMAFNPKYIQQNGGD